MQSIALNPVPEMTTASKKRLWTSIALSSVPVAFLVFDTVIKLVKIAPVVDAFRQLGYPDRLARGIGTLEAACLLLYLVPRTSVLGAVLLTGFLGGAISTHVRVGDPLFSHVLFPIYVAALLWAGLFVRDARVRALSPLSTTKAN